MLGEIGYIGEGQHRYKMHIFILQLSSQDQNYKSSQRLDIRVYGGRTSNLYYLITR